MPEFTRPRHANTKATAQDTRLIRGTLARVGWNELLGAGLPASRPLNLYSLGNLPYHSLLTKEEDRLIVLGACLEQLSGNRLFACPSG
jgi:hypothetical protein